MHMCTPGPKAPKTPSVPALRCGDQKFLTPTGRVLYGVEELTPLLCEGRWEWNGQWVQAPLATTGNCP